MTVTMKRIGAVAAAVVLVTTSVRSASGLEQYREFALGSSTAAVITLTGASARDLKTLHERPSAIQELRWRPSFDTTRRASADPVRNVTFSFVDDKLFRIVVDYDPSRLEGLTRDDLVGALTATYGPPVPLPRPARAERDRGALDMATPIANWRSDSATVTLQHVAYGGSYALVVSSLALERIARTSQAEAAVIEAKEGPARDAALLKKQVDAAREAADKTRSENKESFRP